MKKNIKVIKNIIATLAIAALILTGSAPYFAFAKQDNEPEDKLKSLATYDDSKVPDVGGSSAILMNANNGDIIYEKNAHVVREPASVTKILNFLVVLDTLNMDDVVTIPEDVETRGSSVNLKPGEQLTVNDLVYCMMLESGNDAAEVLGILAGGDLKTFSKMMNAKAKECGATNTNYKNPNGLNEVEGQLNYTTAYDQAMIAYEGLKNEKFREVVSTVTYTIPKTNKSKARKLRNHNACLWKLETVEINGKNIPYKYTGCTGIKTGYTSSAGDCYVGSAKRDNMELIAVTLHSTDYQNRFADAINLWDYGFDHYKTYTAEKSQKTLKQLDVKRGALAQVNVGIEENLDITMNKDYADEDKITTEVTINDEEPMAPIKKGQVMGTVEAFDATGALVAKTDLVALQNVKKGGPLSYIGIPDEHLGKFFTIVGAIALLIILIIVLIVVLKRKRRKKTQAAPAAHRSEKTKSKAKATAKKKKSKKQTQRRQEETRKQQYETKYEPEQEPMYHGQSRNIAPPLRSEAAESGPISNVIESHVVVDSPWRGEPPVRSEYSRPIEPPLRSDLLREEGEYQASQRFAAGQRSSAESRERSSHQRRRSDAGEQPVRRGETMTRREKKAARKQRQKRRKHRNV